jgi:hypothetical protein
VAEALDGARGDGLRRGGGRRGRLERDVSKGLGLVMGDGRLATTLGRPGESLAVDQSDEPKVDAHKWPRRRRQTIQAIAVECDTFCSLCSAPHITEGVKIWQGPRRVKLGHPHHIICFACVVTVARAHDEAP